jgi:uncharacterized membrane protein
MSFARNLAIGAGLGAGLMYFLDPQQGRRRRALVRDQVVHVASRADDALSAAVCDLSQQARGLAAELWSLAVGGNVDDRRLAARVRSRLGRYVSHPRAVDATAHDGAVTLSGPILEHERDRLLRAVSLLRGVREVEDRLEPHRGPGNISDLQGGVCRPGERLNVFEENWSPGTRLLVGSAGAVLVTSGLTRHFPVSCILGTAGLALMARAATNLSWGRMLGYGGRRAVDIYKTVTIAGSVERVFPFFADYQAFPRFMAHVREVRDRGDGHSHWVAAGPAGVPVTWDAVLTCFEPDQLIAWRSEPGSVIPNAGVIRFEPEGNDRTRVDLRFSYNPPGGALGHFAAMLFGADAKSSFDDDLMRLKGLIEQGSTHAPGKAPVVRQDIEPMVPAPAR